MSAFILRRKPWFALAVLAVMVSLSGEYALAEILQISSISPASASSGSTAFTLSVRGRGFNQYTAVRWNGANRTTTYVSSTTLHASISAADVSQAGQAKVTAHSASTGRTSNSLTFTIMSAAPVAPTPLQITTTTLPGVTVGTSCSTALHATGGTSPYAWTVVSGSLPSGLALTTSGTISGSPSAAGQSTFTVQAKDSAASPQAAMATLTITVSAPAAPRLAITSASLPTATAGTAFSAALAASGGTQPYTWLLASGQLPSGMNLSAAGVIAGATSVTGTFPFTAEVSDATGASATAALNLIVAAQSTTPGYTRWYAPTSFWNTPISASASIDPNSAAMVSTALSAYASGSVLMNDNAWGLSYVYATASSRVYTVTCTEYCNSSTTVFPIPAGTLPNTGSDGHLTVINGQNEMDMWQAKYNASTDTWQASDITTTTINGWGANCAQGQLCLGADTAGLALLGGSVRPEEIAQGHIDHALALLTPMTRSGYIACPATGSDGKSSSTSAIPEGAQIQLDPSFNVAAQSWAPWQKTIAVALQQYGAFVNDTGGALALYAVNDINSGNATWSSAGMTKSPGLSWIPWSQMRVLTLVKCGN